MDFKQKILKNKRVAAFKAGARRYYIETKLHTLRIRRQHMHVNVSVRGHIDILNVEGPLAPHDAPGSLFQ